MCNVWMAPQDALNRGNYLADPYLKWVIPRPPYLSWFRA